MAYDYARERRKFFRSLAASCHEKALASNVPETAARWAGVIDVLLWAASDDGEADVFHLLLKGQNHDH